MQWELLHFPSSYLSKFTKKEGEKKGETLKISFSLPLSTREIKQVDLILFFKVLKFYS